MYFKYYKESRCSLNLDLSTTLNWSYVLDPKRVRSSRDIASRASRVMRYITVLTHSLDQLLLEIQPSPKCKPIWRELVTN